jgi:hypothetical protein
MQDEVFVENIMFTNKWEAALFWEKESALGARGGVEESR